MSPFITLSKSLAISCTLLALGSTMARAETPMDACDRLAASPVDTQRPETVPGVATGMIEVKAALEACSQATLIDRNPRFQYQLGRVHFDKQDHAAASRAFGVAAASGYLAAKSALGHLYGSGLGVPEDKARELALTLEAAEAGLPIAMHNAGVILRNGEGVDADPVASLAWFRKAVALGYTQSLVDIGLAYDEGKGVKQDFAEAARWYQQAASHDIPEAFNNLGTLFEEGKGVPQSYPAAIDWYRKAQATGYTLADINMAHLADSGFGMTADPAAAADLVMKAFKAGDASDDAFNLDTVLNYFQWSPAFWTDMQGRLKTAGTYAGPVDGTLNDATRAALTALTDK